MLDIRKNYSTFMRQPLANQTDTTNFFLLPGKVCRRCFVSFVPNLRAVLCARRCILVVTGAVIYFVVRLISSRFCSVIGFDRRHIVIACVPRQTAL
jgi:hypothetical protein